jgi:D-alanyl-D-alanine carboxypeptidase
MSLPRAAFAAVCLSVCPLASVAAVARPAAYKGAIVEEAATGQVIFANNADEVSPPASMTKLMTFAVLQDRIASGALSLQTRVTVVAADTRASPSIIGLKVGEVFPMEELIYAMMLPSANDAALAVAREVAGSVPAFVELMNAKARALGMSHTTFRTPNGLPVPSHRVADGDLTTPRDFAVLCRYLLLHSDILKYTSVRTRLFGVGYRFPPSPMTSHNHLLGKIEGVDGLKTGFTNGAGFCLAATALRNNHRIIVVMMDSPDSKGRDLAVTDLIRRGFTTMPVFGPEGAMHDPTPAPPPAAAPGTAPAPAFAAPTRPAAAGSLPAIQFHPPR